MQSTADKASHQPEFESAAYAFVDHVLMPEVECLAQQPDVDWFSGLIEPLVDRFPDTREAVYEGLATSRVDTIRVQAARHVDDQELDPRFAGVMAAVLADDFNEEVADLARQRSIMLMIVGKISASDFEDIDELAGSAVAANWRDDDDEVHDESETAPYELPGH